MGHPAAQNEAQGLGASTLRKLDYQGQGSGERIYFYNDGCIPTRSAKGMDSYLAKLKILMSLQVVDN